MKRPFIKKQKRKRHGATFWDQEYASGGEHLALSSDESEDLAKFVRWQARQKDEVVIDRTVDVLDLGCGNGRNLIFLARELGAQGIGYDISNAAIAEARKAGEGLPLTFEARSIAGEIHLPDSSQDIILDMMTSHFLKANEREFLRDEIHRLLRPGGWLFMKTFLRDEDLHTARLLKEFPTDEAGTYIHPVIGVAEHAYEEDELLNFLSQEFIVRKVYRSHKHRIRGQARKRRTVSVHAQKDPY
ncbi:MAG: methyltransferase domain-containing protein, partial [Candidatus Paceibacterota bacterium]